MDWLDTIFTLGALLEITSILHVAENCLKSCIVTFCDAFILHLIPFTFNVLHAAKGEICDKLKSVYKRGQ